MSNFLITGYYFKGNLGDELLMKVAETLFTNNNRQFIGIDTINIYNTSLIDKLIKWTDKLILFGGEVINNFFLDKLIAFRTYSLNKFNKFIPFYAIGVSCNSDYNEILSKVDIFETIIFRNIVDYNTYYNRLSKNNIFVLPDPVFYIKPDLNKKGIFSKLLCHMGHKSYNIGLYLSETARDKELIKKEIIKLVNNYSHYNFHLFTMCNGLIDTENDIIINNDIYKSIKTPNIKLYTNTSDVLDNIKKIDIAICWRFHSHVLCIQYNIPFISISDTPKVKNLLNEYNLQILAYNSSNIINGFNYVKHNKKQIKLQLFNTYNTILTSILKYNNLIKTSLNIRSLPKYFINTDDDIIYKKIINKYNLLSNNDKDYNTKLLLYLITGKLKTEYYWGLLSKLDNGKNINELKEDIKWLIKEEIKKGDNTFYYKMVEYTNYNINYIPEKGINIHYFSQDDMKGLHRAGWEYVISNIDNIATFNGNALLCDLYVDRTFHWNYDICHKLGIIPYTKKWIGFIHHTDNETYTNYNIIELFKKQYFIDSLAYCKGFIVLSKYLKKRLMNILIKNGYYSIPVFILYHPTEFVNNTFDITIFEKEKEHKVIQIGAWYRKIDAIFKLELGSNKLNFIKYALNGPAMNGYYNKLSKTDNIAMISRDCISRDNLERDNELSDDELKSVKLINELSSSDYDKLLISCIIFIYLIDASAANTIIEAIVRNTPILINKIEPVVEYLGSGYPFYYESMEEATGKLNNMKLIKKTHEYLKKMDKTFLKIQTFMNNFKKVI
jgi:polysaccharide pyruvyl transferase WcaK-like protein